MHEQATTNPSLIIAIALATGTIAQAVAQHLRIPGIVLLLLVGVLLGPDVLGIVVPGDLGDQLHEIIGFAIAVILFEGGLNLEWKRLRAEGATIRQLVTVGALITWAGGMVAAKLIMGWDWSTSILFGSLVIVTGPTVITPLLRRNHVSRNVETILEAEGVFIDAIGAIIAVVVLEEVLSFGSSSVAIGFISVPTRIVLGAVVGFAGGVIIAFLLRWRGVIPEGLENVFTLACAVAIFHVSDVIRPESGITAVIVAGLVVGNSRSHVTSELREFKEQLTVMLIGLLFVLLAADVRIAEVLSLGVPGILVVLALMLVVRPAAVWTCTISSNLNWREKSFVSWLGPRGIVAAAVATLFYERLHASGSEYGEDMRALVFLVIAVTVVIQGGATGWVARLLRVKRPSGQGYVILGAHPAAILLGRILRDAGEEVVMIDANPEWCRRAQDEGFRVLQGSALEERVMLGAEPDSRKGVIAMLSNSGVNLLFARRARDEFKTPKSYVALQRGHGGVTPEAVGEAGASILFGTEVDIELWEVRARRELAVVRRWRLTESGGDGDPLDVPREAQNLLLPFVVRGEKTTRPIDDATRVDVGEEVSWLVLEEREDEAAAFLAKKGWEPVIETETVPADESS